MQLKDLLVGDKFFPAVKRGKLPAMFEVIDKHQGMSGKILCVNLSTGVRVKKLAKQLVILYSRSQE